MLDLAESALMVIALVLMVISLPVSIIPFISGPLLQWVIVLVFAILTGFERVTVPAFALITLIMLAGTTSDLWLPVIGVSVQGGSCLTSLGSIFGALAGSFLIPIPILGTVIGMVGGALLVELARLGEWRAAMQAGGLAFKLYLAGILLEVALSVLMLAVFVGSLLLTR